MDDEQKKRRIVGMLRNLNSDKVRLEMLASQIAEVSRRTDVGVGATRYDQPKVSATNAISSTVENALIAKEKKLEHLTNEQARLQGQVERMEIALAHLPSEHRILLELRYLENLSWRQIAFHLPYSEDHLRKALHDRAVETLAKYLLPNEER